MEFKQGDVVIYGTHGACNITHIGEIEFGQVKGEYYVLEPCDKTSSTYYVPKTNALAVTKMRKILNAEQLEQLLTAVDGMDDNWIEDDSQRKEHYRELLSSGDGEEIIRMIRTLHRRRKKILDAGKKVHMCDENFLRSAEQLISSEVSQILDIPQNSVGDYIKSKLENS